MKKGAVMTRGHFTQTHKKLVAGIGLLLFAALFVLTFVYAGEPLVRFISRPEQFRLWVQQRGFVGRLMFVGMVVLQVFVAIIPGEPFEIAAGYAFGTWEGTLLCMLGAAIGGLLVFLFVRRFGRKAVYTFFPEEKLRSLRFLHDEHRRDLWIFVLFFIPGTPKDLLCYFSGLTDIALGRWLLISTAARFPSIITSTVGGNALGLQKYTFAIVVFAVTLVLSAAGLLLYRRICKIREKKENHEDHNTD